MIIIYVAIGLVALVLLAAAIASKTYSISSVKEVNLPKTKVYDFIVLLKNQNKFSKWALIDPNMQTTFRGEDGKVGFVSAWESNDKNVGKGEQEITAIDAGRQISYEIRFERPFKSTGNATMLIEAINEHSTRVTWTFFGSMPYPFNLMSVVMKKAIANDLAVGLNNLKALLEG